jgi:hypothetical protein
MRLPRPSAQAASMLGCHARDVEAADSEGARRFDIYSHIFFNRKDGFVHGHLKQEQQRASKCGSSGQEHTGSG